MLLVLRIGFAVWRRGGFVLRFLIVICALSVVGLVVGGRFVFVLCFGLMVGFRFPVQDCLLCDCLFV